MSTEHVNLDVPIGTLTGWAGKPASDVCPDCQRRTSSVQDVKNGWCGSCEAQTRVAISIEGARRIVSASALKARSAAMPTLTCRAWFPVPTSLAGFDPHRVPAAGAVCGRCAQPWGLHPEPYVGVKNATASVDTVLVWVQHVQKPYATADALAVGRIVGSDESRIVMVIRGGMTIEAIGSTITALRAVEDNFTAKGKVGVNVWMPESQILHRQGHEVGDHAAAMAGYGTYIGADLFMPSSRQTLMLARGQGVIVTESYISAEPGFGEQAGVLYSVRLDPLDPQSASSGLSPETVVRDVPKDDLAINTNWRVFDPNGPVTSPFQTAQGWAEWEPVT